MNKEIDKPKKKEDMFSTEDIIVSAVFLTVFIAAGIVIYRRSEKW